MNDLSYLQHTNVIVDNFVNKVLEDGGIVDEPLIINEYNELHTIIKKQASLVVTGGAYKAGKLYGMNPQTSASIPFTFSRSGVATRVNNQGLIETVPVDVPRMDYDPVTKRFKGLLMEKGSTNFVTYSNDFTHASWIKGRCIATPNSAIGPDGLLSATKITADGGVNPNTNTSIASATLGGLASKTFTFSVWMWTDESVSDKTAQLFIYGNTSTENISQLNITLTSTPTRYSVTTTFGAAPVSTSLVFKFDISQTNGTVPVTIYHYAWGAQLEASSSPSSYIPTAGTSVTRGDDICSAPQGSWYNVSEGTQ